ncbi:MAG: glycosyltransferase, partial [Clostridia bacterium]|nr:glycosyltransferase [Clostridia bacterium]
MNKTLAVVVTYNRAEKLKNCLFSLKNQTFKAFDILVVNNASTDETAEVLEKEGGVIVMNEEKNVGGAGGFYDGMQYGVKNGYEYLWLMDDDVVPHENALEKLFEADENLQGEYGFLSSLALFTDGTPAVMNNHLLKSKISTDNIIRAGEETYVNVLSATFVSFFIKTEKVKEYGYPVKEMFLWSDDTEYSTRITKKDRGVFVPQSVVVHA